MIARISLFTTGLIQVLFVTLSTYFISHDIVGGITLSAFMISFVWSFNVKKIAFGTMRDRIVYSLGASTGATVGYFLGKVIDIAG
jgi:hypothetical protein